MVDDCENSEPIVMRSSGLSWREVGGEVIVLDLERSHYVNLNGPAALLWRQIADGALVPQLIAELVAAFDVGPERARSDTLALLTDLRELGLLDS